MQRSHYKHWFHPVGTFLAVACLVGSLWPGGSWAYFLDTASGVRSAGMGEAFVGVADDASAVLCNPAGLAMVEEVQLTSLYSDFYSQLEPVSDNGQAGSIGDMYVGAALPLGDHPGTVGVSWLRFFSHPYQENTFYLSYGHPFQLPELFGKKSILNAGTNLKYLFWAVDRNESVASSPELYPNLSKGGITADVGLMTVIEDVLRVGMDVENLAPVDLGVTDTDPLKQVYRAGVSYLWKPDSNYVNVVQPTLEVSLRGPVYTTKLGVEVWGMDRSAAVRLGVNNDAVTGGLSYRSELKNAPLEVRLDYALAYPFYVTGSWGTHRLGVTLSLDKQTFAGTALSHKNVDVQENNRIQEQKRLYEQSTHTALFIDSLASIEALLVQTAEYLRSDMPLSSESYLIQNNIVLKHIERTVSKTLQASGKLSVGAHGILQTAALVCETAPEVYQSISRTTETADASHHDVERSSEKAYLFFSESRSDTCSRGAGELHGDMSLEEQLGNVLQCEKKLQNRQKTLGFAEKLLENIHRQMTWLQASAGESYLAYVKPTVDEGVGSVENALAELRKIKHGLEKEQRILGEKEQELEHIADFQIHRQTSVVVGFETKYWAAFSSLSNEDQLRKNILGYLQKKSGLDISDRKYNSFEELERDFKDGKIDVVVTGRMQAERLLKSGAGMPLAGVMFNGSDALAECLYVGDNSKVTATSQLKGMRLGYLSTESYMRMDSLFSIPTSFFSEAKLLRDPKSALLALQVQQVDVILSDEYLANIYDIVKQNGVSLAKGIKKVAVASGRVRNSPLIMQATSTRTKLAILAKFATTLRQMDQDEQGRKILKSFAIEQIMSQMGEK